VRAHLFISLATAGLLLTLTGCSTAAAGKRAETTWWKPWTWRADQTVDAAKSKDQKNQAEDALAANQTATVKAAASKVAATGAALASRTNREPATDLAVMFNGQAAALLPTPGLAELAEVKSIVAGLLSTNAQLRADAEKRLDAKDKQLAELQRMTGELAAKLEAAEKTHEAAVAKLTDAYVGERKVADQWREHQAKAWLARIADLLGTGGVIALAVCVPAAAPLAGRLFGFMSKVMPSSAAITGVVAKSGFDNVVAGVERVTAAVKQKDPALAGEALSLLRQEQSPDDERLVAARRGVVLAKRKSVQKSLYP